MSRVEDHLTRVLRNTPNVVTRAFFWKIPHNSNKEDICLKLGRYKKPADYPAGEILEVLVPKSELTLNHEEFLSLMTFLQESYEPFRQGVKAFIPLDKPFESETAAQIRALFSLPDKRQIVQFILTHEIIPEELEAGLQQARRSRAIKKFELMLQQDDKEPAWQDWFKINSWVLGSEFVRVLDERRIDIKHISDFLMQAYDGFLDVVEIKRPGGNLRFWAAAKDHGNYVPSSDLTGAITQASRYIYEVEREANSIKFCERVWNVKTVKPRCILIFGRSNDWNDEQMEAYRIMNAGFHNLTLMSYDHVLQRAKRIVGIEY